MTTPRITIRKSNASEVESTSAKIHKPTFVTEIYIKDYCEETEIHIVNGIRFDIPTR